MRRKSSNFRLNPRSPLARDLELAGFGQHSGTVRYYDSCAGAIHSGNHGTLVNGPTWTAGPFGPRLYFSANNKRVDLAAALTFANGEPWTFWALVTVHTWAVYSGFWGYDYAAAKWARLTTWNPSTTFALANDANTNVQWAGIPNVTTAFSTTIVHDGTNATLYYNAVAQASQALSGPFAISRLNTYGGASGQGLVASWDSCAIWSRALPVAEVSALGDLSNVDLRVGSVPLILPVRRKVYIRVPAAAAGITRLAGGDGLFKLAGDGGGLAA